MMRFGSDNPTAKRAIGLLELIAVLAVVAILAVSLASALPRMVIASRIRDTLHDMKLIHRAIMGDDSQGDYGFVGDMGRPPIKLSHLVESSDRTVFYHDDTTYRVGMGWKGPYLAGTASPDPLVDAFKTPYRIIANEGGRVHSAGPDGQFNTDDDLIYPESPVKVEGPVRIELSAPGEFIVRLYCSDYGREEMLEQREAPYIFDDVHRGTHAVEVFRVDKADKTKLIRQTIIVTNGQGGVYRVNIGDTAHDAHQDPAGNGGHNGGDKQDDKHGDKQDDKGDRGGDRDRNDQSIDRRGGGHRP